MPAAFVCLGTCNEFFVSEEARDIHVDCVNCGKYPDDPQYELTYNDEVVGVLCNTCARRHKLSQEQDKREDRKREPHYVLIPIRPEMKERLSKVKADWEME